MADRTNLNGQKLKPTRDEMAEVTLLRRKKRMDETPTQKRTFVHVSMYVIAPMFILLFVMMCKYLKL